MIVVVVVVVDTECKFLSLSKPLYFLLNVVGFSGLRVYHYQCIM